VTPRERFGKIAAPHYLTARLLEDLLFGSIAAVQGAEELVKALEDWSGQNPRWHLTAAAGDEREIKYLGSGGPPG
jgi:hypothetical protein